MKITEAQLRKLISNSLKESLNELSPDFLYNKASKYYDAEKSLKGKLDKNWLAKKKEQTDNIFSYAQDKGRELYRKSKEQKEKEINATKNNILEKLSDGIYVTCFFGTYDPDNPSMQNTIEKIAIQTKEESAYRYAENLHRRFYKVKIKGPFDSYESALQWVNEKKLSKYHDFNWDSQEIKPQGIELYVTDDDLEIPNDNASL